MAGLLGSLLPGLLSSFGGNEGFIGSAKKAVGNIFNDLGSGRVNSGADFGKSLARGIGGFLGVGGDEPKKNAGDRQNAGLAKDSADGVKNAVDRTEVAVIPHNMSEMQWSRPPTRVTEQERREAHVPLHSAGIPGGGRPELDMVRGDVGRTVRYVSETRKRKDKKKASKKGAKSSKK